MYTHAVLKNFVLICKSGEIGGDENLEIPGNVHLLFAHFKYTGKYEIINKFNQIKFQGHLGFDNQLTATSPCSPLSINGHLSCVLVFYHVDKN